MLLMMLTLKKNMSIKNNNKIIDKIDLSKFLPTINKKNYLVIYFFHESDFL